MSYDIKDRYMGPEFRCLEGSQLDMNGKHDNMMFLAVLWELVWGSYVITHQLSL